MPASSADPSWREAARRGFSNEDWRAECAQRAEAARNLSDSALIAGVRRWTARLNEAGPGSPAWDRLVPWAETPRGPIVGYAVPTFAKALLELDAARASEMGAERVWVDWATGGEARPPERGFEGVTVGGGPSCAAGARPAAASSSPSSSSTPPYLALNASLATPEARTEALGALLRAARDAGVVVGWRDEPYPVSLRRRGVRRGDGEAAGGSSSPSSAPGLLCVERASAKLLGIKAYGVHLNLYRGSFEDPSSLRLWLARRSRVKPTWPGRLDNAVAGGQPSGLGIVENARKECAEEAGVDAEALRRIRPAGAISYASAMVGLTASGLDAAGAAGAGGAGGSGSATPFSVSGEVARDVMFVADLPLHDSFEPSPADGEAEGFVLLPAKDALRIAATTDLFKDNCNLVVADFCLRAGLVDPDADGYLDLVEELRWGECK